MKNTLKLATGLVALCVFSPAFAAEDEDPRRAVKDDDKQLEAVGELPNDGEEIFGGGVIREVRLENGSRFVFVDLDGGVGMFEEVEAGGRMLQDHPELRNASLIDVFLAVTAPGTDIPAQISRTSKGSNIVKPQGWARDLGNDDTSASRANYCSNSTFSNAVVSTGYDDRGTPSLRLDKTVGNTGYFENYTYCGGASWPGGCPTFYRYKVGSNIGSVWYNVDKYYTLVSLCGLGNHPTITTNYGTSWTHPGPLVEIQYRNSSNNGWYTAISKDFTASEIGKTAGWHYWGGTGVWNFDWRTRIGYAELNDKFDIGHAVEDLGY